MPTQRVMGITRPNNQVHGTTGERFKKARKAPILPEMYMANGSEEKTGRIVESMKESTAPARLRALKTLLVSCVPKLFSR